MSGTLATSPFETGGEQVVLQTVSWETYERLNDDLGETRHPRMIYSEGVLTIMSRSKRHEWLAECLGLFVITVAGVLDLECEPAGEATFRRRDKETGLEGDRTFYLGDHARETRAGRNFDPAIDPPPDLAIEVEVTHSADNAMIAWGRLGTSEVWRFDDSTATCTFWGRCDNGQYQKIDRSRFFSMIGPDDVSAQVLRAAEMGTARWQARLS